MDNVPRAVGWEELKQSVSLECPCGKTYLEFLQTHFFLEFLDVSLPVPRATHVLHVEPKSAVLASRADGVARWRR